MTQYILDPKYDGDTIRICATCGAQYYGRKPPLHNALCADHDDKNAIFVWGDKSGFHPSLEESEIKPGFFADCTAEADAGAWTKRSV